jgi:6-phosphogluconolactonase
MSVHRFVAGSAQAAAGACARHMAMILEQALGGNDIAALAVSGGKSPIPMFGALAAAALDWSRVHLFLVDERCVPATHEQSNFRMVEEALAAPARIPHRNVHRVHTELAPGIAAERYADEIARIFRLEAGALPKFDLIHLGMGADAHIASLFPGDPLIEDRERIAGATYVEKAGQWRVTLLPGVLLAAHHTVVFSPGRDKVEVLRRVFEDEFAPSELPAQLPAHLGRGVAWFGDAEW